MAIRKQVFRFAAQFRKRQSTEQRLSSALGDSLHPKTIPESHAERPVSALVKWVIEAAGVNRTSAELVVMTRVGILTISEISKLSGLNPQSLRQTRRRVEAKLKGRLESVMKHPSLGLKI